jgi:CheY-like chemotaxis protein
MEELLEDDYDLISASSGQGCLDQVGDNFPALILLDVSMAEMDGLETCRRLKQNPHSIEIPVIFISALASDQELMAGYEAGGDDYITKPFSGEILQKKIEVVLASQRSKQELRKISENAVEALMDSLSDTGELGLVGRFLRQSSAVNSLQDLAAIVFECLGEFDLDCSLLIVSEPENLFWFSDDIDRPMERQILQSLHGQDRLVSFGTRLAINSDMATILIRNIPHEKEKADRLRDNLTILIEGLDTRILDMQAENKLQRRRRELAELVELTRQGVQKTDELHEIQQASSRELFSKFARDMETAIARQELTQKQHNALMKAVKATASRIKFQRHQDQEIDVLLKSLIDQLAEFLRD